MKNTKIALKHVIFRIFCELPAKTPSLSRKKHGFKNDRVEMKAAPDGALTQLLLKLCFWKILGRNESSSGWSIDTFYFINFTNYIHS